MTLPRHAELWLPGYMRSRWRQRGEPRAGGRVWVAIADHWEPLWNKPSLDVAKQRVQSWASGWPAIASRHADSRGRRPQYTFYYPEEEYRPEFLDVLAGLRAAGVADVDVHIHHDGEGEQNFIDRMSGFIETLAVRHGLLRRSNGQIVFGFIHGNWALDNSRPDGRCCGLNNEITILRKLGCYADFTMPSAGSPTQARMVNTIYWAVDDPARPRSYDTGIPVRPGSRDSGDLLMIPGPLAIRWSGRLLPRLECGELAHQDLPTPYRIRRWLEVAPRIGSDIFIKLHAHGTQERNSAALLAGGGLDALFRGLSEECRTAGQELRYVSTWEMRQAVERATEARVSEATV